MKPQNCNIISERKQLLLYPFVVVPEEIHNFHFAFTVFHDKLLSS